MIDGLQYTFLFLFTVGTWNSHDNFFSGALFLFYVYLLFKAVFEWWYAPLTSDFA